MASSDGKSLRVGLAGFGAVGMVVARRLAAGIPGLALAAVSARDPGAAARLESVGIKAPVVALDALAECADIVVEAFPAAAFRAAAEPAIAAGRIFMPLSVGALLDNLDLIELAKATGARIIAPTGALLGLDAVRAAAEGEIATVRMITRKPPAGLVAPPTSSSGTSRSTGWPRRSRFSTAPPARAPVVFPPTSMSRRRSRSRGLGPTARSSKSGPTPRSSETPIRSRSRRTAPASA